MVVLITKKIFILLSELTNLCQRFLSTTYLRRGSKVYTKYTRVSGTSETYSLHSDVDTQSFSPQLTKELTLSVSRKEKIDCS